VPSILSPSRTGPNVFSVVLEMAVSFLFPHAVRHAIIHFSRSPATVGSSSKRPWSINTKPLFVPAVPLSTQTHRPQGAATVSKAFWSGYPGGTGSAPAIVFYGAGGTVRLLSCTPIDLLKRTDSSVVRAPPRPATSLTGVCRCEALLSFRSRLFHSSRHFFFLTDTPLLTSHLSRRVRSWRTR